MSSTPDDFTRIWRLRGVEVPCPNCKGLGTVMYGSGSTWRGGVGTASCERDVCDKCWGTGDLHRIGVDLRKMEKALEDEKKKSCIRWLESKTGISFLKSIRPSWKYLIERLKKEENRIKIPKEAGYYQDNVSILRKALSEIIEAAENADTVKDIIE